MNNENGIVTVDRTTVAGRRICAMTPLSTFEHLSVGPGGVLYGFVVDNFGARGFLGAQRLVRCDPSTGTLTVSALPFDIGRVTGPLTTVGGVLYGATKGIYPSQGGVLFRLAPEGTVPALDSDGDTLPNGWETSYGLDPFGTGPGSGAGDDPDGDGRTNAQDPKERIHADSSGGCSRKARPARSSARDSTSPTRAATAPPSGPVSSQIRAP